MKDSAISWTDHTFNPWIGCHRVSAGCLHCYAETRDRRYGEGLWGKDAPRRVTSDANWRQPLRWNRDAEAAGAPAFVFCASLADVFEDRADLAVPRARLFDLIAQTPHLVWMLLTKRPENVRDLVPPAWAEPHRRDQWPHNVWIGTTVEDDAVAFRLFHLCRLPAPVRFVSAEPLIGSVNVTPWMHDSNCQLPNEGVCTCSEPREDAVDWVIVGGESGPGCREMNLGWARSLVAQCREANVPVWFKQVGGTIRVNGVPGGDQLDGAQIHERPTP